MIIHIPANNFDDYVLERMRHFPFRLLDFGLDVSTGPVVDFRVREFIKQNWGNNDAPLLYPSHFFKNCVCWPRKNGKKPNAIEINRRTIKWLMPNGNYVLTRRFSSKEEPRRIVPALFFALDDEFRLIGFENHLNVIHSDRSGISKQLAKGLTSFLASSIVDIYFRQFSGHTQVNARDLKTLPVPDLDILKILAGFYSDGRVMRGQVDAFLEKHFSSTLKISSPDPVELAYS